MGEHLPSDPMNPGRLAVPGVQHPSEVDVLWNEETFRIYMEQMLARAARSRVRRLSRRPGPDMLPVIDR